MNKFNIGDNARCIINYSLAECIIKSIYKKHDNIVYGVEAYGYEYDMYDYELGKKKDELRLQLQNKITELQGILDSIK